MINPAAVVTNFVWRLLDRLDRALLVPAQAYDHPAWLDRRNHPWQARLLEFEHRSLLWRVIAALLVIGVIIYHTRMLFWWTAQTPFDFDAIHTYLPMAKELLSDGPRFFLTERAVSVPPFAVIFPALFGGELAIQRHVNMGLSVLVIGLMFRTGYLLHSLTAGVLAAGAYGLSPHFGPYMSTGSVEAIYIFLMAASTWALAEGWRGAKWGYVVAGLALGLATMTRATIFYFLPIATVGAWWLSRRMTNQQQFWRGVRNAHIMAMVMVVPLIFKNITLWGIPAVSTGAGIALLNGHHPLTYGFEANYFNFETDNGFGAQHLMSHLGVRANASMTALAKYLISELPSEFLLKMYALKTAAFLFVSNREWIMPVELLRNWRVVLLGASLVSLFTIRRNPVVAFIWIIFLFQVAIHIPALYSHRYSVSAVDLPLAILAAVGAGFAVFHMRWWFLPVWSGIVYVAWALSVPSSVNPHFPMPNVYGAPHRVVATYNKQNLPISQLEGFSRDANGQLRQDAASAFLQLDFTTFADLGKDFSVALVYDVILNNPVYSETCNRIKLEYRGKNDAVFQAGREWRDFWRPNPALKRYIVGTAAHIRINEPGVLRMHFSCQGATLDIEKFEIVHSTTLYEYSRQYLQTQGTSSWREWYSKHGLSKGK